MGFGHKIMFRSFFGFRPGKERNELEKDVNLHRVLGRLSNHYEELMRGVEFEESFFMSAARVHGLPLGDVMETDQLKGIQAKIEIRKDYFLNLIRLGKYFGYEIPSIGKVEGEPHLSLNASREKVAEKIRKLKESGKKNSISIIVELEETMTEVIETIFALVETDQFKKEGAQAIQAFFEQKFVETTSFEPVYNEGAVLVRSKTENSQWILKQGSTLQNTLKNLNAWKGNLLPEKETEALIEAIEKLLDENEEITYSHSIFDDTADVQKVVRAYDTERAFEAWVAVGRELTKKGLLSKKDALTLREEFDERFARNFFGHPLLLREEAISSHVVTREYLEGIKTQLETMMAKDLPNDLSQPWLEAIEKALESDQYPIQEKEPELASK